jgi:hypothetical protein
MVLFSWHRDFFESVFRVTEIKINPASAGSNQEKYGKCIRIFTDGGEG